MTNELKAKSDEFLKLREPSQMLNHIKALQEVVDNYEERLNVLRSRSDEADRRDIEEGSKFTQGFARSVMIMEGK
jgi:hypothetical protein